MKRLKAYCVEPWKVYTELIVHLLQPIIHILEGFFDGYISRQLIQAKWTSIPYPAATSVQCSSENALPLTPDMRGGHQMCIDPDAGQLFLYGGWNGSRELGDLWQFTIASNTWTCLSLDTLQEVCCLLITACMVWHYVS